MGVHLKGFLENNFDIPLHLFDLNIAEDKPYFLVSDAISKLLHKDFEILETTNQVQFTWRLIGSSLGAYTAARFASLFPSRVDKLVLLAPAFNLVEIWNSGTNDNLLSHWKEKGYQEFLGPKSRPFSVPFEFVEDLQKHPPFISVACEGTVIHGSEDQVIPLTSAQAFVESYAPHWKLRIVKDDHALMKQDTIRIIEKETVACFDLKEMEIT
ncbi:hydrolase [Galdieria sulphuraria]|uniref:Hydrolase n=1 Tax=Galdieria sulphuraria TaxID=130081 RepID=M2W564_GALSU|nr:hydrolase [Galdieria sulphuraria]EME30886.1 hydrolase [Galdieria sulphuraria]|eukprot:XP_005707406.1 hydrolase [Galdieria sulphuraria]